MLYNKIHNFIRISKQLIIFNLQDFNQIIKLKISHLSLFDFKRSYNRFNTLIWNRCFTKENESLVLIPPLLLGSIFLMLSIST